jgi:hypothetical protein
MSTVGPNLEDDLNFLENGRRPQLFGKMEEDLNVKENVRRPQFKCKWETTLILRSVENDINILIIFKWKTTLGLGRM